MSSILGVSMLRLSVDLLDQNDCAYKRRTGLSFYSEHDYEEMDWISFFYYFFFNHKHLCLIPLCFQINAIFKCKFLCKYWIFLSGKDESDIEV